jgi:predicted ATP-dependent Lon-type protease
MGLFDFLKPKPSKKEELFERMSAEMFPRGEKDIKAVTDAVLLILNNVKSREDAKSIALKSMFISKMNRPFELDRLKEHLTGYSQYKFSDHQVQEFYNYIGFVIVATELMRKTPSNVVHDGNDWKIL